MPKKKTKLVGFQTDEDMHGRVVATAREKGFDTYADWMRNVVSSELEGHAAAPRAHDPDVISKLATIYGGYFAPTLAKQLHAQGIDQAELMHRILRDLTEIAAAGHRLNEAHVAPAPCIARNIVPIEQRAHKPRAFSVYPEASPAALIAAEQKPDDDDQRTGGLES